MPIDPHFLDMPCGINDPEAGDVGVKFAELQEQLVPISDVSPAVTLIKTFLESYRNFYCQLPLEQRENYPPNRALGSLFDL